MSDTSTPKNPGFEASLTEINQLIETMEKDDQTLEQSLSHFERGIELIKHCQTILANAEQKVQILIENNQREHLAAYEPDSKKEIPTC